MCGKLLRHFLYNLDIGKKFLSFVVIVIITPLFIALLLFYLRSEKIIYNELVSNCEYDVLQYKDRLENKRASTVQLAVDIASNTSVQMIISQMESYDKYDVIALHNTIVEQINSLAFKKEISVITDINLMLDCLGFPYDGNYFLKISSTDMNLLKEKVAAKGYAMIHESGNRRYTMSTLSFIVPIKNIMYKKYNEIKGFVKVVVDSNYFFRDALGNADDRFFISVSDENGSQIYISDNNRDLATAAGSKKGRDILITTELPGFEYIATFVFDISPISNSVRSQRISIAAIFLILLVISIAFSVFFSANIKKRINIIIKKTERIENGNFDITESVYGNDEVGVVDRYFNNMAVKIKNLIHENYVKELEKKEAMLSALQFQINPHFMYNTLETISAIAEVYKCEEICEISQSLGDMLRYATYNTSGEGIQLQKEIEHVSCYLRIQNLRFNHMFKLKLDISDEAEECKTLKFIIQPIVENSIKFGFINTTKEGIIAIKAEVKKEFLIIEIKDNGVGMAAGKLHEINTLLQNKKNYFTRMKNGIGLVNVNERIKLAFGSRYGLSVDGRIGSGTRVTMLLPVRLDGSSG